MGKRGSSRLAPEFGTLIEAGTVVAPDSAEGGAAEWPVFHALSGFRVASMPSDSGGHIARFLVALWPLMGDAALEVRWMAADGVVTCYLMLRLTAGDSESARDGAGRLAAAASSLATALLSGWTLQPLDDAAIAAVMRPFDLVDAGDLLRCERDIKLADGREFDVPILLGVDPSELGVLVRQMAECAHPTILSVAAAPTEIDEAERAVLLGELASLERAVAEASIPESLSERLSPRRGEDPLSLLASAATTLQRRVNAPERLGFLRVSLASQGPLPQMLVAAAQDALAASALALEWVPACEQRDRDVCAANVRTIAFAPWGIQAVEQAGHESVNDCYLASIEEIASELVLPVPDGFLPVAHDLVDPAPRAAVSAVPSEGRTLGTSLLGGRMLALSHSDRLRHTYVVGQTGTGKSTLLLNLAVQDIREGKGVCVIDPHGDLVDGILDRFPKERIEDLILFDPTNMDRPVPMNLLDASTPEEQDYVVQQMIGMLYRIYDPSHQGIIGPRFENMFRNAALVAMAHPEGGTLLDIARLFTDDRFLAERLAHATDPTVRSFWIDEMGQTSAYQKSEVLGWFTSKFGAFASNRFMRAVVGQRESAVSMREVMDTGKVLLVKLPRGTLGETNALWLGLIFIVKVQMAALARGTMAPSDRREFNLYVDEFQNFAMTDFDLLVAEARKYGLALTLAHQHVGQLTPQLRSAIFGNVASWVMFRLGMPDAVMAAEEIEGYSARDLTRLANYRCVVRTSIDGQVVPPFDLRTMPPSDQLSGPALRLAAEKLSALKYGRPMKGVEAEFLESWGLGAPKGSPEDAGPVPRVSSADPASSRAAREAADSSAPTASPLDRGTEDIFGPPVFGESVIVKLGRRMIATQLRQDDLDGALAAFRKMFAQMKHSADCWAVYDDMAPFYAEGDALQKYEELRVELEALAAGR